MPLGRTGWNSTYGSKNHQQRFSHFRRRKLPCQAIGRLDTQVSETPFVGLSPLLYTARQGLLAVSTVLRSLGRPPSTSTGRDRVAGLLEILTGPDQGKTFPLESELLHIGRGADNGVVLSDPSLGDFHVSLSQQAGRLSLYANEANQIMVGGTLVPGQQWVPVPADAKIHLGGQTEVRVTERPQAMAAAPATAEAIAPASGERRRAPRKESKRQVAKPITGRTGEIAVQMGADGKFPELALATGTGPTKPALKAKESNPALLFTILAGSCLSSAGLLLIDFETSQVTSSQDQSTARSQLVEFYGSDSAILEPYQRLLRQASVESSQGHRSAERQLLKQVLGLLNSVDAADPANLNGLTGKQTKRGKRSDQELRELLQSLLD